MGPSFHQQEMNQPIMYLYCWYLFSVTCCWSRVRTFWQNQHWQCGQIANCTLQGVNVFNVREGWKCLVRIIWGGLWVVGVTPLSQSLVVLLVCIADLISIIPISVLRCLAQTIAPTKTTPTSPSLSNFA